MTMAADARRPILALLLAIGLLVPATAIGADSPEPDRTADTSAAPSAPPELRISWQRAVDLSGAPLFGDAPVIRVAVGWSGRRVLLLVEGQGGEPRLWRSEGGRTWEPVGELPEVRVGERIEGLTGHVHGWVAHGHDPAGRVRIWRSADGRTWERLAPSALRPFRRASVTDIAAVPGGLMAYGVATRDGRRTVRFWVSEGGGQWREQQRFAEMHPGSSVAFAGVMGDAVVSFGLARSGRPATWVSRIGTLRYLDTQRRGSAPLGEALPSELHAGRDAGLALVPPTDQEGRAELWRSVNAWDWQRVEAGGPPWTSTATFASDGSVVLADALEPDGTHAFFVSTDAETWKQVHSDGEQPDTADVPLLTMAPAGVLLVTEDGAWLGTWSQPPLDALPLPVHDLPDIGPIGADPPLRPPVKRPSGRRPELDTTRPADARRERDGVRLEMWLPQGRVRQREWLPAHVRITNTGPRAITFGCGGAGTWAQGNTLFGPGKRWTGNAAEFKRRVLATGPGLISFGQRRGDGDDCPGSVGLEIRLRPGGVYEYDLWAVPRYQVRMQPLPSGRLPVITRFGYDRPGETGARHRMAIMGTVRLVGPRWPWATPQQLVDAMLEDPRFRDWIERRDRPIAWSNTTFHGIEAPGKFYWSELGFEGPAPDGTVHVGLFAGSWSSRFDSYGRALLDPWTAQVLGFTDAR